MGSYDFYMGNSQMIKCAPNLDLCSYNCMTKKGMTNGGGGGGGYPLTGILPFVTHAICYTP